MKKILFALSATVLLNGILLSSCDSTSKKIENAEDKVLDAKEAVLDAESELNQARQDSITEFLKFKIEHQNQIRANEKSIADLRLGLASVSKENKAIYEKKLAELEGKNNALKIRLTEYNEEEKDQWQSFKTEFKSDMNKLGKAFSDFTVNNQNKI